MEERRAAQEEIAQQQEKVSQAQSELDAQQEQVRNFQVMTAEIEGMTSAYYQYLKALDTPNQGAIFDQVPSMVEALEEAVQSGRMFTDDVESTAQFIMGTGIDPFSYTHLDVYKRQWLSFRIFRKRGSRLLRVSRKRR